jgi:hypothetical protein
MAAFEFFAESDFLLFEFHFPSVLATLRRTWEILVPSLFFMVGPVVIYGGLAPLVFTFLKDETAPHWEWRELAAVGLRMGLISISGLAVIWSILGGLRALDNQNPWDALPFVSPTHVDDFATNNPGYSVSGTLGAGLVHVYDHKGHSAWIDERRLQHAKIELLPCPDPFPAEGLAGLPLYPGSHCELLIKIRRADVADDSYVFSVPGRASPDDIGQHYRHWADSIGASSGFYGSGNYFFEAQKEERRWNWWLRYDRYKPTELYLPQGGYEPPLG